MQIMPQFLAGLLSAPVAPIRELALTFKEAPWGTLFAIGVIAALILLLFFL
jgi:hypothetical protein